MRRMESDYCFVCGPLNSIGLHLDITEGDGWARARWVVEKPYIGYDNILHGGIITAIMDDLMAHAIYCRDVDVMTVHLELDFRSPAHVGDEIICEAHIAEEGRRRSIKTAGNIYVGDRLVAEAKGVMVIVQDPEKK